MTEQEKFDYLISKGWYATEDGKVIGFKGKSVGSLRKDGYYRFGAKINKKDFLIYNHRFIYYYFKKIIPIQVDHINGIRDDNRIENLRNVTAQGNHHNYTKAKGYSWRKSRNKWRAYITLNSKFINLGHFDTEAEARQAYLDAKKVYHIIKDP